MTLDEVFEPPNPRIRALLIGVGVPKPVTDNFRDGYGYRSFAVLPKVDEELSWFRDQLKKWIPAGDLAFELQTGAAKTTPPTILSALDWVVKARPAPSLLIVYLSGHGVQLARTQNPDDGLPGSDPFPEAFVTSDGLLIDSEISECWDRLDGRTSLVVIVDTCHARGIVSAETLPPEISVDLGPRKSVRLQFASSKEGEDAPELATGGIIYSAMRAALDGVEAGESYQSLYDAMAMSARVEWSQQIQADFSGPDDSFLYRQPFRG